MKCSDHFYVCIKDLFPDTFSSICRNSEKICPFLFPLSYFNEQSINRYTLSMLKLAILINYSFTTRSLIPLKLKISAVIQRYHYALNYIAWVYSSFENIALHQQCNRYSAIITRTILKHRRRVYSHYHFIHALQIGSISLSEFFPLYDSFTPCVIHAGI